MHISSAHTFTDSTLNLYFITVKSKAHYLFYFRQTKMSTENLLYCSGFDLIDEQFVKVEKLVQSDEVGITGEGNSNQRSIRNESIVYVGKSHWWAFLFLFVSVF